jgi:predicted transcriptional regulator of viral defense system
MQTIFSSSERQKELYQLAESQGGYFTAKQAAALGYASNKRSYHVRAHNWIREHRGIYRLALFPEPERPDLILWWLWSRDRSDQPTGVFSHQTALSLHDLTDTNPAKLDLTVPKHFRRGVPIPKVLRLHYGDVAGEDRELVHGVPVTNALRAILDVWTESSLPKPVLREAFHEAMKRGNITKTQVATSQQDAERASALTEIRKRTKGSPKENTLPAPHSALPLRNV